MTQHIISICIVCIVCILLWFYYTKSTEQDNKYIPISQLVNENTTLRKEVKKLRTRLKYLERYKTDLSKTFKILDSELVLINDHLKKTQTPEQPSHPPTEGRPPNILDIIFNQRRTVEPLISNSTLNSGRVQPIEPLISDSNTAFDSIFNQFLTAEISRTEEQILEQQPSVPSEGEEREVEQSSLNYMPMNSHYRQYLLNSLPTIREE